MLDNQSSFNNENRKFAEEARLWRSFCELPREKNCEIENFKNEFAEILNVKRCVFDFFFFLIEDGTA